LYGCTASVDVLLRHGAGVDPASPGQHGSPLHVAAYKDRLELAALLVAHGACLDHVSAPAPPGTCLKTRQCESTGAGAALNPLCTPTSTCLENSIIFVAGV